MLDFIEQDLAFGKVMKEVVGCGGKVSPQLPNAGWRYIEGNFTAYQLRVIADQIEKEFKQ